MGNVLHEQGIVVRSLAGSRDTNFLQGLQTDSATLPASYRKGIGSPVSEVKRQTFEDDHSHYPVLKLRMSGALLSIPHTHSYLVLNKASAMFYIYFQKMQQSMMKKSASLYRH
jgi:hypothetical protein